eukprot:1153536-Pelagomonas_calceolata.AAC.1
MAHGHYVEADITHATHTGSLTCVLSDNDMHLTAIQTGPSMASAHLMKGSSCDRYTKLERQSHARRLPGSE